jgi:hypothetical protein
VADTATPTLAPTDSPAPTRAPAGGGGGQPAPAPQPSLPPAAPIAAPAAGAPQPLAPPVTSPPSALVESTTLSGPANAALAPGVILFQVTSAPDHSAQAEVHLDPSVLAAVPDSIQLRLIDSPPPAPSAVQLGALGGGDAEPVGPPLNLRLLAIDRTSGQPVGLPDAVAASTIEVRLPVPPVQLGPGEHIAWLMELDGPDGQFFGYVRPLATFDPVNQQLVVLAPANQLHDVLFLPVILHAAFVRNPDAAMHMWSSALPDAIDLGVAAPQFTRMEVLAPQLGGRLLVLNAFTGEPGWVDVSGVGPVPADDGLPAILPPADAGPPAPEVAGATVTRSLATYAVQQGDWLKCIAARFHVSLAALLAANPMPDPDLIAIDQRLQLPGYPSA